MKHIFTTIKQFITKPLLVAFALLAMSGNAWGQTYNGGKWYSLYEEKEYSRSTAAGGSIHTYSAFAPNDGTFSFDTKLPGKSSSSNSGNYSSDPKDYDYGVENYSVKFGNVSNSAAHNVSVSANRSGSGKWYNPYKWTYNYTYNYTHIDGSGLNTGTTSIDAYYEYKLANTLRTVYIKNVKVPLAKHILMANGTAAGASSISKTFDNVPAGSYSEAMAIDFRSFLTSGNMTVKLTSGDKEVFRLGATDNTSGEIKSSAAGKTYSVGNNACASANGEVDACSTGKIGRIEKYSFNVYFCPKAGTTYNGTITITDGTKTATVSLTGTGDKLTPTVVWSPDDEMFNEEDVLTATNPNDLTVTLSSTGNETYVNCDGNSATMLAATSGKITINAHVTGNDVYNDYDVTKEITITSLIKQHIVWTRDLSHLKTTDANKTITLDARAEPDNLPVSYALYGDHDDLTLTYTESTKTWTLTYSDKECRNATIVASQAGDATHAPATSVSRPIKVIDPNKECGTGQTVLNSKSTIRTTQTIINDLEIPKSMTLKVSKTDKTEGLFSGYALGFAVEFYSEAGANGKKVRTEDFSQDMIGTSETTLTISNLDIAIKSFKIVGYAVKGYDFTYIAYEKHQYCTLSSSSLSFATSPNNTTTAKTFDIDYANYPISLTCSNPKFTYTPTDFGDCGEYGKKTISVTYTADENEGTDVGYLYVKDNTGTTLEKCTLNVTVAKISQEVTSTTIGASYKSTDKVTLSAEATSGLTNFVYSATPSGVALFDGSEMTFEGSGTIAITATQPGNTTYKSASKTVENVVVSAVTPAIASKPVASGVKCYGTLSNDQLTGGEATVTLHGVPNTKIDGHFEWKNVGETVNKAAGTYEYPVVFKPANSSMYNEQETTIQVEVVRADGALAMNDGEVEVSVTGNQATLNLDELKESATDNGALSYEVTSANAAVSTNLFSASVAGEYTVTATKAQTDYYTSATTDFTVVVKKRTPSVDLSALSSTAINYGDELSQASITGTVGVTNSTPAGSETASETCIWKDASATPSVGTSTAKATFTSATGWYNAIEIDVPITVNPIDASYAATATVYAGQSLSEVELVNATTGLGGEAVSGSVTWKNDVSAISFDEDGTQTLPIVFTSSNANYNNGEGLCTITVLPGVVFNGGEWTNGSSWSGGVVPTAGDRVIIDADVTISSPVEVTALTINAGKTVTIANNGVLTIGEGSSLSREEYGNIVVEAGGKLNLNEGELDVNDFTLYSIFEAQQPKSGQVNGQEQMTAHGKAYFILDLDPAGKASYGWYTFTVPFPVDELRGVSRLASNGEWQTLTNERNYAVMAFYENLRTTAKNGWKKYTGILQPGVAYTMTIDSDINTYRFEMLGDGTFDAAATQHVLQVSDGEATDKGWNGLGNGTMRYITIDEEPVVQVYNHSGWNYLPVDASDNAFAVGAAYFYQADNNGSELNLSAAVNPSSIARAPQREDVKANNRFGVTLKTAEDVSDRLFVTCDDEATGTYTIGKDVQKMGDVTGAKVARVWTNAKGTKLCAVNTAYTNNQAIIPLQIFSPAKAEYTLSLDNSVEEDVYLTRNDIIVWNLASSDYIFELNEGTDDTYALQVVRRVNNTATGVDQLNGEAKRGTDFVEKMIVNGQLFILRNGVLYDAQGKKVSVK